MSDEIEKSEAEEQAELEQIKALLAQDAEAKKGQAAAEVEEPAEPSPVSPVSPAPENVEPEPTPVTPKQSEPVEQPKADTAAKDDPMEWARKKGLKSPEDMARLLLQKEREFHETRQRAEREQPPAPPAWQPAPQMGYGYPPPPTYGYPPPMPRPDARQIAAQLFPEINPDDAKAFVPAMFEVANATARQVRAEMEQKFQHLQIQSERTSELMTLAQDPAFHDARVQREIHSIIESDPAIYQRERRPNTYAFEKALASLARKQLQQGVTAETLTPTNRPPVTAGGGNGSARPVPTTMTPDMFDRLSVEKQEAFLKANGARLTR